MILYRIVLADDHTLFRAGLKGLIEKDPLLKIVSEVADGEQLLEKLKIQKCDLVVMDLSMPNMDGMQALKGIRKEFPKIKVLVLTMQKDQDHFKHAMSLGASGYLLKDDAYEQLILAIKSILKGKKFISASVSQLITEGVVKSLDEAESSSLEILTKRELQVLKLVASGLANKNVAARLKISVRTVETHRANLTQKLGIKNTAGLVKYAISKGLL